MAEFASKGIAGAGLGLGIAGTTLGLMNNGLGNLFGMNNNYNNCNYNGNCSENCLVNRYELDKDQQIARLESQIAIKDANSFTDKKIAEVFERLNVRLMAMDKENCEKRAEQGIVNAKVGKDIAVLNNNIMSVTGRLDNITKEVIPNSTICPGWGDVKVCIIPCDPQPTANKKQ